MKFTLTKADLDAMSLALTLAIEWEESLIDSMAPCLAPRPLLPNWKPTPEDLKIERDTQANIDKFVVLRARINATRAKYFV